MPYGWEIREKLESLMDGDVVGAGARKLEGVSFAEYCASLRIKTTEGIKPFELFPWQVEFTDLLAGPKALTRRQISLLSSRQTGKTSVPTGFDGLPGAVERAVHRNYRSSNYSRCSPAGAARG